MLSRLDNLVNAATKLGVAYLGYQSNQHWSGAIVALVALELAKGGNLAGGIAGTGILGVIGATNLYNVAAVR